MEVVVLLAIGGIGYELSIWLDLLVLRELGAARESVIFATAPLAGAGFAFLALQEALSVNMIASGVLMVGGVVLLLNEDHAHWHRQDEVWHEHKHLHNLGDQDQHSGIGVTVNPTKLQNLRGQTLLFRCLETGFVTTVGLCIWRRSGSGRRISKRCDY